MVVTVQPSIGKLLRLIDVVKDIKAQRPITIAAIKSPDESVLIKKALGWSAGLTTQSVSALSEIQFV